MDTSPPPTPQAVTFVVSPYHDDGFVVRENHCPVAGDYRQRDGTDRWVAWYAGVQDLAADLHKGGAGLTQAMTKVPGPLAEAHCHHLNQEHAHGRVAQGKSAARERRATSIEYTYSSTPNCVLTSGAASSCVHTTATLAGSCLRPHRSESSGGGTLAES